MAHLKTGLLLEGDWKCTSASCTSGAERGVFGPFRKGNVGVLGGLSKSAEPPSRSL